MEWKSGGVGFIFIDRIAVALRSDRIHVILAYAMLLRSDRIHVILAYAMLLHSHNMLLEPIAPATSSLCSLAPLQRT